MPAAPSRSSVAITVPSVAFSSTLFPVVIRSGLKVSPSPSVSGEGVPSVLGFVSDEFSPCGVLSSVVAPSSDGVPSGAKLLAPSTLSKLPGV